MKNNLTNHIKKTSSVSLVLLMAISLLTPFQNVFAAGSGFTTSLTQANVSV